jgi:hypothetical protein
LCGRSSSIRRRGRSYVGFRKKHEFAWGGDFFACSFRAFYYTASPQGVLVFHAFVKKTQRTPPLEIELARKRLKELLDA